nr:hypothetical protein [Tanacetum cinerariifolium]
TVPLFAAMLVHQGKGSGTPTEPHYTPSPEDRATIDKFSTLPHDSAPRVTSPAAVEGSMQQTIPELTALCASLQRQLSELTDKFQAQEVEINRLKERVKQLEEREEVAVTNSRDDAPIKRRSMDEGEAATERVSDDTEEMATMLTSIDAATVLASGVVDVSTGSGSISTASTLAEGSVPTSSEEVPTASLIFATATVVTPVTRRKGKEFMVESKTPKKQKVQEQIDAQVARELEEQLEKEDQRRAEQIARDAEIARIHAEEELQSMIDGLDSNNETKSPEEITKEAKYPEEVTEEKVKEMMHLVPIEEVYVEALQVKHPIIDWKFHSEGQRSYWKITRLGVEWKLYDSCRVHHVAAKDKEIFMLVEKDYPLRKGLALVMICYKLQVENFSQMENELVLKIYRIANSLRQQGD